jgi:hypothetical protein
MIYAHAHTPGPWSCDHNIISSDIGVTIAIVTDDAAAKAANGVLMASSPFMLEALEAVREEMRGDTMSESTCDLVIRAIKAAKGMS